MARPAFTCVKRYGTLLVLWSDLDITACYTIHYLPTYMVYCTDGNWIHVQKWMISPSLLATLHRKVARTTCSVKYPSKCRIVFQPVLIKTLSCRRERCTADHEQLSWLVVSGILNYKTHKMSITVVDKIPHLIYLWELYSHKRRLLGPMISFFALWSLACIYASRCHGKNPLLCLILGASRFVMLRNFTLPRPRPSTSLYPCWHPDCAEIQKSC